MADTLIFTPGGTTPGTALTVTPVPGSVSYGDGHDDRGGGEVPNARAGKAANGSCQVVLDGTTNTVAAMKTLMEKCCINGSGVGDKVGTGGVAITGTGAYLAYVSYYALVDVSVEGDAVQVATISWKGSATQEA